MIYYDLTPFDPQFIVLTIFKVFKNFGLILEQVF